MKRRYKISAALLLLGSIFLLAAGFDVAITSTFPGEGGGIGAVCTVSNNLCPPGTSVVPNTVIATIGTLTTSSATPVSSGSGVSMTVKNSGNVEVRATCQAFAANGITRINLNIFFSNVGIPTAGNGPNAGDVAMTLAPTVFDPTVTTNVITLPLEGFKTGVSGAFFVYVVVWSGNGVNTVDLSQGTLIVSET